MCSNACVPWTVREGWFLIHQPSFTLLLFFNFLRQHSGEISSMLDSSSSFTNSKTFPQTCLKDDIIYTTDCFTYFCKSENHYINQKSYVLYFPFITSLKDVISPCNTTNSFHTTPTCSQHNFKHKVTYLYY